MEGVCTIAPDICLRGVKNDCLDFGVSGTGDLYMLDLCTFTEISFNLSSSKWIFELYIASFACICWSKLLRCLVLMLFSFLLYKLSNPLNTSVHWVWYVFWLWLEICVHVVSNAASVSVYADFISRMNVVVSLLEVLDVLSSSKTVVTLLKVSLNWWIGVESPDFGGEINGEMSSLRSLSDCKISFNLLLGSSDVDESPWKIE